MATEPIIAGNAAPQRQQHSPYRGFVAGVASGIAKLTVGHPFDTIKVRLQTTPPTRFRGPLDCLLQTVRHESIRGLYKGATPPLIGWMFMDSIMLGSLTTYRALLKSHVFPTRDSLPSYAHGIAGMFAGWTVSFVAAPIEHVKARLQVQYRGDARYRGPVDCALTLLRGHGVRGLYHGLSATLVFRSFFFFWWAGYDVLSRVFREHTDLSVAAVSFWAGGISAQLFWLTSYPSDVVKQRIMTDELAARRLSNWRAAAKAVLREQGVRGYWRGFVPCFLRAFPANAVAIAAFEGAMRTLP